MNKDKFSLTKAKKLKSQSGFKESYHRFDKNQIAAIMTAWHTKRPLLVKGDPGLGKSQIAHAIAQVQQYNLLVHVVNSRTEAEDLLYKEDHIARLAMAQMQGHKNSNVEENFKSLEAKNFMVPGPLWWAYDPLTARQFFNDSDQYQCRHQFTDDHPTVLLIDEIDKADSELPNALLEVLNNGSFHVYGYDKPIGDGDGKQPFVVITSNDERKLPGAFLRRCVVLHLPIYEGKEGIRQLMEIAKAHKPRLKNIQNWQQKEGEESAAVVYKAAELLIQTRENRTVDHYRPGTSEFLDLLLALNNNDDYQTDEQRVKALYEIKDFILDK